MRDKYLKILKNNNFFISIKRATLLVFICILFSSCVIYYDDRYEKAARELTSCNNIDISEIETFSDEQICACAVNPYSRINGTLSWLKDGYSQSTRKIVDEAKARQLTCGVNYIAQESATETTETENSAFKTQLNQFTKPQVSLPKMNPSNKPWTSKVRSYVYK